MLDVFPQASGRLALARWDDDGGAQVREGSALPEPVIELERRLGITKASDAKLVSPTQTGDIRMGQGKRRTRFRTRQTFDIAETSFTWREKARPFGAISVREYYCNGAGTLDVKVFGLTHVAHMGGPAITKGDVDGQVLNYCRGTLSSWEVA